MRIVALAIVTLILCDTGLRAQNATWVDMWRLDPVATTQLRPSQEKWRERLPLDVSTALVDTAEVPTWQLDYGGTAAKAGRQIAILNDIPADKMPRRWVVAPQSSSACNLGYATFASRIESNTALTEREKLDGVLAHFAVAYGQCSDDTSIPAIVIRFRYGVALKDMCRHHGYLTCGEAFKVLAKVLTDVRTKAYDDLINGSPDRRSRVFDSQVLDGINETFFYAIEKTTYFRLQEKTWKEVNICALLSNIRTHPLASKKVQDLADSNKKAVECT